MSEIFGPEEFARLADVSRETLARLEVYAGMLAEWNARHNLVSRTSLGEVWRRHFWDSAQLLPLIPAPTTSLIDLGSGAGFPGLILAELLRERQIRIVLIEATGKKVAFLQAVAERLGLGVEIRRARIEDISHEPFEAIVARACAPMTQLLVYAHKFWGEHSTGLFLKGQNLGDELTRARKYWKIKVKMHSSRSDPSGTIVEVGALSRIKENRRVHGPQ